MSTNKNKQKRLTVKLIKINKSNKKNLIKKKRIKIKKNVSWGNGMQYTQFKHNQTKILKTKRKKKEKKQEKSKILNQGAK